jgi:hypothetical protein
MDRSSWPTRKLLRTELPDHELVPGTLGERMAMIRQLTLDSLAMMGITDEPRVQRNVVRIYKRPIKRP